MSNSWSIKQKMISVFSKLYLSSLHMKKKTLNDNTAFPEPINHPQDKAERTTLHFYTRLYE